MTLLAHSEAIAASIERGIFGAGELTRLALIAWLSEGHLLLEGMPGTGKTAFARLLAASLGLELKRVQCTPDLMPGDVLGANLFDFREQRFTLTQGPVFTEFLLVDEINRTPPKTQSALLEAMQERRVTIDGKSYALPESFFVVATQNPVEHEGTYPLPEAQLDRFVFKPIARYPDEALEVSAVLAHPGGPKSASPEALGIQPVLDRSRLSELRQAVARVRLDEKVARYIVALVRHSRTHRSVAVGLSTRAATVCGGAARAAAAEIAGNAPLAVR
ncbi:MAG: AAA family ATPase, partial [Polyangiales bacterium]